MQTIHNFQACTSFVNYLAGSSSNSVYKLITSNPSAVRLGNNEEYCHFDGKKYQWSDVISRGTNLEIIIDHEVLGGGFVAVLDDETFHHNGTRQIVRLKVLAGKVEEADLFFGDAYQKWAFEVEEEALEFFRQSIKSRKLPKRLLKTLDFAAGVGSAAVMSAPHEERRKAWICVLRALGVSRSVAEKVVRSVRTVPAKAARRLGWWSSSFPQPEFWEGLKEEIASITLS